MMNQIARATGLAAGWLLIAAPPLTAQTDYFNSDGGRPLTIEDAYPTERYAFELQVAPLKVERARGGIYTWTVEPEIAYGILPRTHIELGVPVSYSDVRSKKAGIGGLELAMLHNLNVETSLPAFAVAADVLLPVGSHAPEEALVSAKAIATKTFRFARFHVNGQFWLNGSDDLLPVEGESPAHEALAWLAGLAADKAYPLRSMLIGAELFAEKSNASGADVEWNAAAGVRKQLTPAFNMDFGVGKQLTGDDRKWFVTFGLSRMFAVRGLLPGF
jgi:hypothetical protein